MKVYFHLNPMGFSNCYLVVNEKSKEVILIDPGKVTEEIITQVEENQYKLTAILITHNNGSHAQGLKTLTKIYSPKIYGADWDIAGNEHNNRRRKNTNSRSFRSLYNAAWTYY